MRVVAMVVAGVAAVALAVGATSVGASTDASRQVVVPPGQPVQIAFTAVTGEGEELSAFSASFRNAISLAVATHRKIRGFPIRVNTVETSCGGDNTGAAASIVGNAQTTAVIGHICSDGFVSALPVYEAAGVVTITGSATRDSLPAFAPSVFNRVHVREGDGALEWYETVKSAPRNFLWRGLYQFVFGEPPQEFADSYFDATRLLLTRLEQVSRVVNGHLVIDRSALAHAVRETTGFFGVTCAIDLDPETGNRVNDPSSLARCTGR